VQLRNIVEQLPLWIMINKVPGKTVRLTRSFLDKALVVSLGLLGTRARQDIEVTYIRISITSPQFT